MKNYAKTFKNKLGVILWVTALMTLAGCNQNESLALNKDLSAQINTSEIPANVEHIQCEITGVLHKYYNCLVYNYDNPHFSKLVQLDITSQQGWFKEETNGEFAEAGQAGFEFNLIKEKNSKIPVQIYTHLNDSQSLAENVQLHYLEKMLHDVLTSDSQSS
jgi:hypothetical protein